MKARSSLRLIGFFLGFFFFSDNLLLEVTNEFPWELFYPAFIISSGTSASQTDSNGHATFKIKGETFAFQFIDEATGTPLPGLSLGLAVNMSVGVGVLMIVDPKGDYCPQPIILHGEKTASAQSTRLKAEAASNADSTLIRLSTQPSRTIDRVILQQLPRYTQTALDAMTCLSLAELTIKALGESPFDLGEWGENLGMIEKKRSVRQKPGIR